MRKNDTRQGFEMDEPEDDEHSSSVDGGEVEDWEPLQTRLLDFRIQQWAKKEKMRYLLISWLIVCFTFCMLIGVISYIIWKDTLLLASTFLGDGFFAVLFLLVYKHFFPGKK